MRAKIIGVVAVVFTAVAVLLAVNSNKNMSAASNLPSGHQIKCLKADGETPCGAPEISALNDDLSGLKKAVGAVKSAVTDTKTAKGDAKQSGSDGQQVVTDGKQGGSDAKKLGSDVKNKDIGQGVKDAKTVVGDGKQAEGDVKTATGDAKTAVGDATKVIKDLKGIGSLSLLARDGSMSCQQETGEACSDAQTKALQIHAAQKNPALTIEREADEARN
jgi:hypothetical protein